MGRQIKNRLAKTYGFYCSADDFGLEIGCFQGGYLFIWNVELYTDISRWCRQNCKQRWRITKDGIEFKRQSEAALFRMMFC